MINHMLLVKYAEVHLKGQNRPYFQRLLLNHVRDAVKPFGAVARLHDSRIMVTGYHDEEACAQRVSRVFGVHSVCLAVEMPKDNMEAICAQAASMMQGLTGTFKVTARRADKHFYLDSPQINVKIGGFILDKCPNLRVDVHQPQHTLQVEIREHTLLYASAIPAVGGLPIGSNGKAMLLLSGGIDSPVAGYRVAKRGVLLNAVYFHSFPFTGEQTKEKVKALAEILASYCGHIRLHVVPFTEIQTAIHERCPDDFTTLLMRRSMMRIAEIIARGENAQALVTGESIGQVASQTMESLVCTDAVVDCPVFRPLIGMDKLEIIRESEKIGTYETSCLPYEDCCTVFTPRHPVTHPQKNKAVAAERVLAENGELDLMIARAVEGTELFTIVPKEII
jgi:thiamine biosynthesis protein ThiI